MNTGQINWPMSVLWREKMSSQEYWTGPIVDQHIHLDRENRYLGAIEDFVISGGSGIMLVHKPDFHSRLPLTTEEYKKEYENTIRMGKEIRSKFKIDVGIVLGPHPVVWEKQSKSIGLAKSSELHLEAIKLALDYIENDHAHCLGEVGRPHYSVSTDIWDQANEILLETFSLAKSAGTSVQLHVEENGEKTCEELSKLCSLANFPKEMAIRHFSPPNISQNFNHGLSSTINMGKNSILGICETIQHSKSMWGMETDFLDDDMRPGAVLGPKTIPKRTQEFYSELVTRDFDEDKINEILLNVHCNWPNQLYGLDFDSNQERR